MLNSLQHKNGSSGRCSPAATGAQPASQLKGAARRATQISESDSLHWKQLVEAEARLRLKRNIAANRK